MQRVANHRGAATAGRPGRLRQPEAHTSKLRHDCKGDMSGRLPTEELLAPLHNRPAKVPRAPCRSGSQKDMPGAGQKALPQGNDPVASVAPGAAQCMSESAPHLSAMTLKYRSSSRVCRTISGIANGMPATRPSSSARCAARSSCCGSSCKPRHELKHTQLL